MNKCVFLDRDGVLNQERGEYTYRTEDFIIPGGVSEALTALKKAGYLLIIITNQGGIAKGIYKKEDVLKCYQFLQTQIGNLIDAHYYSPYHISLSNSLGSKPGTLLFEKAVAKYKINCSKSWMVGDSERDMEAGLKMNLACIGIHEHKLVANATFLAQNLWEASKIILKTEKGI